MTPILAHLPGGVAILLAVAATTAGADAVPPADIVTLAPSSIEGPAPCNAQAETGLDQVITPGVNRIPFVIPDGQVFVLTGVSWFETSAAVGGVDAIQIRLVNGLGFNQEVVLTAPASASGEAAAVTTHPGIVVAPGVGVCARARSTGGVSAARLDVRVYGYFSKAKLPAAAPSR